MGYLFFLYLNYNRREERDCRQKRNTGAEVVNIGEIASFAESLEQSVVQIHKRRCLTERTSRSQCDKCTKVCPTGALSIKKTDFGLTNLVFSGERCVACGACASICPSEAIIMKKPNDAMLHAKMRQTYSKNPDNNKYLVFACARMAARHKAAHDAYVELPCLARLEESLLLEFCSLAMNTSLQEIILVDGNCSTCKYKKCDELINLVVESTNELLWSSSSSVRIKRAQAFPHELTYTTQKQAQADERRGFFSSFGTVPQDALVLTASYLSKKEGIIFSQKGVKDLLKTFEAKDDDGKVAKRHERIVDALDKLNPDFEKKIKNRKFVHLEVDPDKCSACGLCTLYCNEGGLVKSKIRRDSKEGFYYEYSSSNCIACGLCADICDKKSISYFPEVSIEELFNLEPRLISIPPKGKNPE